MNSFDRALGLACGRTDQQMMQEEQHRAVVRSAQLQTLQTALLGHMSDTLGAIHAEVVQTRQMQAEALAIQQELLGRERLQARLEELTYQTEKLVAECGRADGDLPPSTRYYLLGGVLRQVEDDGIGTAVIRGRDNKAAFEAVIKQVGALHRRLEADPDVQDALRWAEKANRDKQRRLGSLKDEADRLRASIDLLRGSHTPVTLRDVAVERWKKLNLPLPKQPLHWALLAGGVLVLSPLLVFLIVPVLLGVAGGMVWLGVEAAKRNRVLSEQADREAEPLERKLRAVEEQMKQG